MGNTDVAVIPGGLTSVLQPLYVSINKPFKDTIRVSWNQWMLNRNKTFTKGGNTRAPSLVTMCEWVRDAWQQLDPAIIVKAFQKSGISNALDGTEDDYLWREPNFVQETSEDSKDDDLLNNDNDFYDGATNTCNIEEWTKLFGNSNSDAENCFEGL